MAACAARFDPTVEAAFQRVYGLNSLAPGLSPRRLWVLLRGLPPGSFPNERHDAAWSTESHLLASLIDAVNWLTYVQVAKASKGKPKKPVPVARPGGKVPQKGQGRTMRLADMRHAIAGVEGVKVR